MDALLVLATVGLLKSGRHASRRVRVAAWLSFLLGIAVSLAANIAAAPTLAWQPVLVAGWPPVALLLAVELMAHRPRPREDAETEPAAPKTTPAGSTTQEIMWAYYLKERERGRTPTGAEPDRVAGTNNYGRTVLRQWREQGRIPSARQNGHARGGVA